MTKDELLNTLRKKNINNYNDKILDRDEYILKLLLTLDDSLIKIGIDIINLYEDDILASEAIDILKRHPNMNVIRCLTNETSIKGNVSLEGAEILCGSKEAFNASCCCDVLCNETAIKSGIVLEGAKIINQSKNWYNAYYGRYPLTDINVINAGYSLIGANIINNSDKEYKALFASMALCSEYLLSTGNVVDIAEKINTSSDWKMACEILDKYLINDKIHLKEDTLYKDKSYSLLTNNMVRRRVKY